MGELERLHQARLAKAAQQPKGERRDPTEWAPRPNVGYERVSANVQAQTVRSEPLHYRSLADLDHFQIVGIEAAARGSLIATMDQQGVTVDERGVRCEWQLVVKGHGFKRPDGFVHPEAPADVQAEGRLAWKRCVEMASDSLQKFIYAMVWRKRDDGPLSIEAKQAMVDSVRDLPSAMTIPILSAPDRNYDFSTTFLGDDDIVDGEIVED